MQKVKIKNIFFMILPLVLSGCEFKKMNVVTQGVGRAKSVHGNCDNKRKISERVMVVFVHGTVLPSCSLAALGGVISNSLNVSPAHECFYQRYVRELKKHGYFKYQPLGADGLEPIVLKTPIKKKNVGYVAQFVARMYESLYELVNDSDNQTLLFYTFNWTGRLDNSFRLTAARNLYDALTKEVARLKQDGSGPIRINLVTHSHGGNVALYLARAEEERKCNMVIDALIAYGCPVQIETMDFVHSPIFKKIYHIYSESDRIQVLDCVSTKKGRSERTFTQGKFKLTDLPAHVQQIAVAVDGVTPSHGELWLLSHDYMPGFAYRFTFPLYPVPVAIFTSCIINLVKQQEQRNSKKDVLHLDINTKLGRLVLRGEDEDCTNEETELPLTINIEQIKRQGLHAF